jgi:hypothetical protein
LSIWKEHLITKSRTCCNITKPETEDAMDIYEDDGGGGCGDEDNDEMHTVILLKLMKTV